MTVIIFFNYPGVAILVVAFAVAYGIGNVFGFSGDGPMMIVGGALAAALDLAYRLTRQEGHWFVPNRGSSLFFLPVWGFGVLWLVIGLGKTFVR